MPNDNEHSYEYISAGAFKVTNRITKEAYHVNYFRGKWTCGCKSFKFNPNRGKDLCKHIKDIKAQLADKDMGGII